MTDEEIFIYCTKITFFGLAGFVLAFVILPYVGKEISNYNKRNHAYKACEKYKELDKLYECHEKFMGEM